MIHICSAAHNELDLMYFKYKFLKMPQKSLFIATPVLVNLGSDTLLFCVAQTNQ